MPLLPHPKQLLRRLLCLIFPLAMGACSTMTTQECRQANWRALGWHDGNTGEMPSTLLRYQQQCAGHGVNPNRYAYIEGWHAGAIVMQSRAQSLTAVDSPPR